MYILVRIKNTLKEIPLHLSDIHIQTIQLLASFQSERQSTDIVYDKTPTLRSDMPINTKRHIPQFFFLPKWSTFYTTIDAI